LGYRKLRETRRYFHPIQRIKRGLDVDDTTGQLVERQAAAHEAPEVATAQLFPQLEACDMWSLGLLLWELFTQQPAPAELTDRHACMSLTFLPPPLRSLIPALLRWELVATYYSHVYLSLSLAPNPRSLLHTMGRHSEMTRTVAVSRRRYRYHALANGIRV